MIYLNILLQTAVQRLRAVEESVESERAAHLETKFNSEIVQVLFVFFDNYHLRDFNFLAEFDNVGDQNSNFKSK